MGTILAILGTLGTIAATLGLDKTMEYIDFKRAQKKGLDSNTIVQITSSLINEAKSKGSNILSKLADKMSAIQLPFNASGEVKGYFNKVKRDLSNKYQSAKTELSRVEDKLNTLSDQASNYIIQPDSTKILMGSVPNSIKEGALEQINKISEVEKKIYEK